jgi:hypothetical protein
VKAFACIANPLSGSGSARNQRRAVATRGDLLRDKGSRAPSARRAIFPALLPALLLVAMTLGASSASAAANPTIPATFTTAVTTNTAVLNAKINPQNQATAYHFEYGTVDCEVGPCESVPLSDSNIGSGEAPIGVAKEITGLQPGTDYHFRVVATNQTGTTEGPDTTFTTFAPFEPDTDCPNQAVRYGPSTNLLACRAYEMVSPIQKNGGDIATVTPLEFRVRLAYNQSAPDGDKFTYSAATAFAGQASGRLTNQYLASRDSGGWTTQGIDSPKGPSIFGGVFDGIAIPSTHYGAFHLFTPDLAAGWLVDANRTPLTPDAGADSVNLYRRDNFDGSYQALTTVPAEETGGQLQQLLYAPFVEGHSSDFDHIVFAAKSKLTPDAASEAELYDYLSGRQIYDYTGGGLHLVSVKPDGTADPAGANVGFVTSVTANGMIEVNTDRAVSEDGSRIYWSGATSSEAPLFVRVNSGQPQSASGCETDKSCTVPVSDTEAVFWTASTDGSRALYTKGGKYSSGEGTLYEFDLGTQVSTPIAGESYGVLDSSEDLSRFYFLSKETLDVGASAGQANLYLDEQGTISFIGTLAGSDLAPDVEDLNREKVTVPTVNSAGARGHATRATADGRYLAFESASPSLAALTDYDNTDALNGKPDREVYIYDAEADRLTCVSCNPSGARPVGQELQWAYADEEKGTGTWAAAWMQTRVHPMYYSGALSEDGSRLYFNSFDALVPQDVNGVQDVYEWQAVGTGSCNQGGPAYSVQNDGCVSLISTGTSPQKSEFVDATPDGSDVFIETSASIDPGDPGLIDIYDARVNGGFAQPTEPAACEGETCQTPPPAPDDPTPASSSFEGAGNVKPPSGTKRRCSKGKRGVRRAGKVRCVRKRGAKHSPGRAANTNRRAAG